jgi:hypothetical protein
MLSPGYILPKLRLLAKVLALVYIASGLLAGITPAVLTGASSVSVVIIILFSAIIGFAVNTLTALVMLGVVYLLLAIYEMLAAERSLSASTNHVAGPPE